MTSHEALGENLNSDFDRVSICELDEFAAQSVIEPLTNVIRGDRSITHLHKIRKGEAILIGIEEEEGVIYEWSPTEGLVDPTLSMTLAAPERSTTYTLTARTFCESIVTHFRIKILESLF